QHSEPERKPPKWQLGIACWGHTGAAASAPPESGFRFKKMAADAGIGLSPLVTWLILLLVPDFLFARWKSKRLPWQRPLPK
ncbi:MAG: hypothetical protein WBP86_09510, partial [Thiobacillaceae bacterium]